MLTRMLALELAKYNIRVNAIAPSIVKTDLSKAAWSSSDLLKQTTGDVPLGRLAETDDIVGSALFLASEASIYMTGHTIVLDGGLSA